MDKFILKGVLQKFDYKSNGRIYPPTFAIPAQDTYFKKIGRKSKIKSLFNVRD